jgi:hypothetical protein
MKRLRAILGLVTALVSTCGVSAAIAEEANASTSVTVGVPPVSKISISRQSIDLVSGTFLITSLSIATNLKDQRVTAALDKPLPEGVVLKLTAKLPEKCGVSSGENLASCQPVDITSVEPGAPEGELSFLLVFQRSDIEEFNRSLTLSLSGGGQAVMTLTYHPQK